MPASLDISAIRSLAAIADCGGYHRAAEALGTTQSTVSQHVRKLEMTLGRTLLERHGRVMRFTPDGERLLADVRPMLLAHDGILRSFGIATAATVVIGSTEHAADHLLPVIRRVVLAERPDTRIRLRIDRGHVLADAIGRGTVDVAVLLGADLATDRHAGDLPLRWYAAPGWTPPTRHRPLPLVVIDGPCTLRRTALAALAAAGWPHEIVAEAGHLAGAVHAVRAGAGVALLAYAGPAPEGLSPVAALPPVTPVPLHVRRASGVDATLVALVSEAVRSALTAGEPGPR